MPLDAQFPAMKVMARGLSGGLILQSFLWGAAVAVTLLTFIVYRTPPLSNAFRVWIKDLIARAGFGSQPPVVTVEPEPEPVPEPAIVIEIKPPDFGNIRPVLGEESEPTSFGIDVHEFPDMSQPVTRFEDFNRRLFIIEPQSEKNSPWPNSTSDDFPTKITGMPLSTARKEIRRRLRPRYPVILDSYGYWSNASAQLEHNPDYTDEFVEAYLAIPESSRPVVVSVQPFQKDGYFTCIRYGFEDFRLNLFSMRFHLADCLTLLFRTMIGPRDQWLWLSVARMRQTVIRAFQANEVRKREDQASTYLEQQTIRAKREAEHRNRFVALFQNRVVEAGKTSPPQALQPSTRSEITGGKP